MAAIIKYPIDRDKLTYEEAKRLLLLSRGAIVDMLELAVSFNEDFSSKERDVLYRRLIDWQTFQEIGKELGVTRERVRQIEAKAEEKLRHLTKTRI